VVPVVELVVAVVLSLAFVVAVVPLPVVALVVPLDFVVELVVPFDFVVEEVVPPAFVVADVVPLVPTLAVDELYVEAPECLLQALFSSSCVIEYSLSHVV
jgi:hypothetical protein